MYFLVKKPGWLVFDPTEYDDEEIRSLQVRHRGSKSNTKLVKFEDGSWYLKNGSQMFLLTNIALKRSTGIGSKCENTVSVVGTTDKKWFIKSNKLV